MIRKTILPTLLFALPLLSQVVHSGTARGGTITGQIQVATAGAIKGGTLTFSLSQPAIVSNIASIAAQQVACYTSAPGNIIGVADRIVLPSASANTSSGTLVAGTYYIEIYYISPNGTSVISAEQSANLTSQGGIFVSPPSFQPASGSGYGIAIGTTSGGETIQGSVTGWTQFTQSTSLISGSPIPTRNTSSCNIYLSDPLVPTGAYYTVNLVNKNSSQIAGFPQTWCTYGGGRGVVNASRGTPTGNCNTDGVFYPPPILSNGTGAQSVNTPISSPGGVTASVQGNVAIKQFQADNTIYVSVSGSDSNDGLSWGTAKATLSGALAALPAPGVVGRIQFGAGTWIINNVTLPAAASNLESLRIIGINAFRSAPNGGLAGGTIFSNTSSSSPTIILGPGTAGVTIEGIYFTSATLNSTTPHIFDNAGATGINSQNAFINDYFQGGGYGIQISAPGSGSNFETYILSSQFNQQTSDCVHVTSLNQGSASQLTIRDSRCQLFGVNGLNLSNTSGVLIDNNQITSNAGSRGDDIVIAAGGGASTTISNNELESLPSSNASTHALNLSGNSFTIFNNSIFNTTFGISCTCNNSNIGTNNFGNGESSSGWDVNLQSGSSANIVSPQAGSYPKGYLKDLSGNSSNQMFSTDGTGTDQISKIGVYNGMTTAGQGVAVVPCATSQKTETGADSNVLTCVIPGTAGSYRIRFVLSLSAASSATLGWTATWTDSNGNAQTPTNLSLFQSGTAAPGLTFTTSSAGNYYGQADIDVNNSATSIVVKLTFSGSSFAGKASASIERII
jgi:hypothetical protein